VSERYGRVPDERNVVWSACTKTNIWRQIKLRWR
jgi:hypothetical protein